MRNLIFTLCLFLLSVSTFAQFNSGSTGADGTLNLSTCPDANCTIPLPESGILNYTTVNIPAGKTLRFLQNTRNTPVTILAQGAVVIGGAIVISAGGLAGGLGDTRTPGPGGFYGGTNGAGLGPGGGIVDCGISGGVRFREGKWVGPLSLVPIVGGSGGAGVVGCESYNDGIGGGGGGAITIASSTSISMLGGSSIAANGTALNSSCGAGGAIRLVGNTIAMTGSLSATCLGRPADPGQVPGVIRIEAPVGQINFSGSANPIAVFSLINEVIIPTNPATLLITSIGGFSVSPFSMGRPDRIDVLLPTSLGDPISVAVQGANIPSGTEVQFAVSGAGAATGCTLTGGPGTLACNGSVTGLNRTSLSTIMAYAIYTPPGSLAKFNPKGKNQVAKIRLETTIGSKTKYIFLRKNGTTIDSKLLSPKFLKEFGM